MEVIGDRTFLGMLRSGSMHQRSRGREPSLPVACIEGTDGSISCRERTFRQTVAQLVYHPILRQRKGQSFQRTVENGRGNIIFVLPVIFPIISVGIFLALILILVPAMIILCLCLQTPPGRKMLPITCLHKSILIPKRFIGKGIIERNRPWKSPGGNRSNNPSHPVRCHP